MKIILWYLIWAIFAASMAGMLASTLLWSKSVRNLIVIFWLAATDALENQDLTARRRQILDEILQRLLLNQKNGLSWTKVSTWAAASSVLFTLGTILQPSETGTSAEEAAKYFILSLPFHLVMEVLFSFGFIRSYRKSKTSHIGKRIFKAIVSGMCIIIPIVFTLIITAEIALEIRDQLINNNEDQEFFQFAMKRIEPVFYNGPNTLFFLLQDFEKPLATWYFATLLIFASCCTTFATITISVVSLLALQNKFTLRCTAVLCESIDRTSPFAIFSASATLFGLITGLMHAYTFTSP